MTKKIIINNDIINKRYNYITQVFLNISLIK